LDAAELGKFPVVSYGICKLVVEFGKICCGKLGSLVAYSPLT